MNALFVAVVALCLAAWPAAALAQPPDLAVGQEWSVKGTTAKAVIGRIEPYGGGKTAVSISLLDVPTDHGPILMAHAPFDKPALVASLDQLLATGVTLPSAFEQGYQTWKSANGGVFTLSVAQVIALVLQSLPKKPNPAT
jgi:hypothetical protein